MSQQAVEFEIHQLLREIDNRLCADCNSPLGGRENVYGCLNHGVWLCSTCAGIHKNYLKESKVLHSQDPWTSRDVEIMKSCGSNIKKNKVVERYIPDGVMKIGINSSEFDREAWINMKYKEHAFMYPNYEQCEQFSRHSDETNLDGIDQTVADPLPTRLLNHFVTIGPGKIISNTKNQNRLAGVHFTPEILATYPDRNAYANYEVPEMIGTLVFPLGMTLEEHDRSPQTFSFTLTNANGMRTYGTALIFNDIMKPDDLKALLKSNDFQQNAISDISDYKAIYAPKAIVLTSHYPFFHFFTTVLTQLYRISLSEAPLPLERYVVNFMCDVPLPPKGQVEVVYSIADCIINLRRPPKNRLPMVDFSYRPLFTALHVDCILFIYRCLLSECSVCLYSRNVSLLTPIQEALLSLLFPFVWQGIYIPVLEKSMIDVLDSPVPFLVGIYADMLENVPRAADVVYVDVDGDRLTFNNQIVDVSLDNDVYQQIPAGPKYYFSKLRSRLMEHGAVVHRSVNDMCLESLRFAGRPFLHNEHLTPLPKEVLEDHSIAQRRGDLFSMLKRPLNNNITGTHQVSCTVVQSRLQTSKAVQRKQEIHQAILDPQYNCDAGDKFDAREIREAFLRLLVSLLIDYQTYFVYPQEQNETALPARITSMNRQRQSNRFGLGFGMSSKQSDTSRVSIFDNPIGYNTDRFMASSDSPLMWKIAQSQMFVYFIDERIQNPKQPETLYFNECIALKRNRSRKQLIKNDTPFLSEKGDDVSETFTCPGPETWAMQSGKSFTYQSFPILTVAICGSPRSTRVLVKTPENVRSIFALKVQNNRRRMLKRSSSVASENDPRVSKLAEAVTGIRVRNDRLRFTLIKIQRQARKFLFRLRMFRYRQKITLVQSLVRRRMALNKFERNALLIKLQRSTQKIIKLQTFMRMWINYLRYNQKKHLTLTIQSLWRMRRPFHRYNRFRKSLVSLQGLTRKHLIKIQVTKTLQEQHAKLIKIITALWIVENPSLSHRYAVYHHAMRLTSFMSVQLCFDELKRLFDALQLYSNAKCNLKQTTLAKQAESFLSSQFFTELSSLSYDKKILFSDKKYFDNVNSKISLLSLPANVVNEISNNQQRVKAERNKWYLALKSYQTKTSKASTDLNKALQNFNLLYEKKRKQTIVSYMWLMIDNDWSFKSYRIAAIIAQHLSNSESFIDENGAVKLSWIEVKKNERIKSALVTTIKAFYQIQAAKYAK